MLRLQELVTRYRVEFPKVYNRHHGTSPGTAVYVGRGTPWGNPFVAQSEAHRNKCCEGFEEYALTKLLQEPDWLVPLRGLPLVCSCSPKRCHAETLVRLANLPHWPVEAYFDGICEPGYPGGPRNPGGVAAGGWVVKTHPFWWSLGDRDVTGHKVYKAGPGATNNIAEYEASLDALRQVYQAKWRGDVRLYGDSQLVINQYTGRYQCNQPHLYELLEKLRQAVTYFRSVEMIWVPREENTLADRQSRFAYQAYRVEKTGV